MVSIYNFPVVFYKKKHYYGITDDTSVFQCP